jgi:hypothetical protein
LKKAEDYIGWAEEMQSNSYYEINADFPTKAAIKAFRARISLAAAGYSQYPKSDPVDREFTLVDRPVGNALRCRIARVDNTRRIELLTEARDACKEIYQRYGTSKLTADFEKIFKTSLAGGTESEVLWQLRYESEKQRYMGNKHAAGGVFGPNYTSDWGARYYVMPTFFFDFSEGDTRRDITCQPFQWASNIQQAVKINNMSFGKKRKEWLPNLATGAATFTPNIVVRYADVLLMLAEAENELNGPTGEAQEAFMAVRNRAFGGNAALASAGLDLSSQESFFNAIVNERAFEFAGEQIRRADLIRWGLLKTKIDDTKEKLQLLKGSDAVRQTPYDWVPTDVYTRKSTKPASAFLSDFFAGTAITALDFYGFNRGENAASADEVPGGAYDADTNPTGWTKVTSTVWGAGNSTIASSWYDCLYINGTNAPDEMQLLPVTPNIRALTNETMKDDYGYYTTGL